MTIHRPDTTAHNKVARTGDGTVGKALDVLDRVAGFGRPVRFSELLEHSDYPKATLYRLLQTLTHQRMLQFDPVQQVYTPGLRLVRLAHSAWTQSSLAPVARPHLDTLSARLGETVHLAQLDHGAVLYVDKRNATRPVEMFSDAGKVGPAYCTGVGKAMLANLSEPELDVALKLQSYHRFTDKTLTSPEDLTRVLDQVRARGFAFDDEEHEPGIICVAVPIVSGPGRVLGAVSVTSTTGRTDLDGLAALVPMLQPAARRIAAETETWQFPDRAVPNQQETGV